MRDIAAVVELVNHYAAQGIMLPRTEFELAETLRDFTVVELDGQIVGCGALHFYTPETGEIRSVAVKPGIQGRGIGRRLVEQLEAEARQYELASIFLFTYVPEFFRKLGFQEVDRSELPLKAWKDCMRCPKFRCCDETAMMKILREPVVVAAEASRPVAENGWVELPVVKGGR